MNKTNLIIIILSTLLLLLVIRDCTRPDIDYDYKINKLHEDNERLSKHIDSLNILLEDNNIIQDSLLNVEKELYRHIDSVISIVNYNDSIIKEFKATSKEKRDNIDKLREYEYDNNKNDTTLIESLNKYFDI